MGLQMDSPVKTGDPDEFHISVPISASKNKAEDKYVLKFICD